ncbi:MAG TPA: hypothetical protein VK158_02245, partial [Acidobacteriota bacterium]|nr:hypothetical protein [Acidobacteriota bacterium]
MTQTFMQAVEAYNTYLNNIKNRSAASQSRMKPFLQGMDFQPLAPLSSLVCNHPIYSRQDLTNEQKDAVVLASDWVRAE